MDFETTARFRITTPAITGADMLHVGQNVPPDAKIAISEGMPECEWLIEATWTGTGQKVYTRPDGMTPRSTGAADYDGPYGSRTQER